MIKSRNAASAILLMLVPLTAQAQELPELLQAIDEGKAQQLIQYNSPWLQIILYSAKRSRVVMVDTSLLLKDDDFAVTPFDDTARLHLTKDTIIRRDDSIVWNAAILVDLPDVLTSRGARQTVMLSVGAWDTDDAGRALVSADNRFQFSPQWTFDFFDRPVLQIPEGRGPAIVTGPPPQTAQEIARHKELLRLKKHAFYSVSADFVMLFPPVTYRLVPLQYTPKYHVLFEVDPEKIVPILVDRVPGEVVERTPADQVKLSNFETFIRSLPPDQDVPIVEELP